VIRVAIVEDQEPLRSGLAQLIGDAPGHQVVGAWGAMEPALREIGTARPEVLLCDIGLPGMSGIEGIGLLRARVPQLQVLMLTVFGDDDHVFEAVCAGASGYLLKDTPPARLLEAIAEVQAGGAPLSPGIARRVLRMFSKVVPPREESTRLSPREQELLQLFVDGHSYKTAAKELGLSIDTVRFHIRHVYEKLHVHSKSEAVVLALRKGLLR
jgi:DNA-binding NarL/FixJ family response regulator